MRRPLGYATISEPERRIREYDTITCCHCGRVVLVKPGAGSTVYLFPQTDGSVREEMGAFCRICMAPVCLVCDKDGRCLPFEQRLAQMERQHG